MKIKQLVFLAALSFFADSDAAFAQQKQIIPIQALNAITVKAFKSSQQGTTRYQYRIINHGTSHSVVGLTVGLNYYHNISELEVEPTGWNFDRGIPQTSSTSPRGWHVDVITTEESPYIKLSWRGEEDNPAFDILPGQTLAGFSITTPQPDDHYLTGHWTAYLSDATVVSDTLVLDEYPLPGDATLNQGQMATLPRMTR